MERRDFLKISAAGGAAAALEGCGNPDHHLIRFIPEEDLVPGIATWKPSICTQCPAGCGLLVRVMQGDAEVMRKGQPGTLKMGLAKKLEGNPAHPINQGKLCPRGQAGLQVTYHPDRIKGPMTRSGARGSGQFNQISWDDAMKQLVSRLSDLNAKKEQSRLALLTSPLRGQRQNIVRSFSQTFQSAPPIEFAFFDEQISQLANGGSFGHTAPFTVDLGQSNYVISFGADFLGTWNSPVAQSIGYGHMRNGRPGQRAKFVHVEPRMSQTAASADEWIPCKPGTEGAFALSLAHVILRDRLRPASIPPAAIGGWAQGLPDYAPEKAASLIGVSAATLTRIAHEAAANVPAVVLIGGAATAHTNGSLNALAVNALNFLLGSAGKPGGVLFSATVTQESEPLRILQAPLDTFVKQIQSNPDSVQVLLLYNANPVFATPAAWGVREAFEKIPFIASFGSFIDETSALADLILPDHSLLESWLDDAPPSGSTRTVVSVAEPAMHPLHDTRAMPDVLLDVAHQLGGDFDKALPWKTYEEAIEAEFAALYKEKGTKSAKDADEFWKNARAQGGWWSAEETAAPVSTLKANSAPVKITAAEFDGDANEFPFHFLPFASQLFYDGSLANLPWMQEAPDPLSTVMWGTWVEINPKTAEKLAIRQGDLLEVTSQHGKLRAPALVTPGIAPDVVAMPVGQGHENFTRYATGRGANPISILAPMQVEKIGSLAWAATRVKVSAVGHGKLVLFGGSLTEAPAQPR